MWLLQNSFLLIFNSFNIIKWHEFFLLFNSIVYHSHEHHSSLNWSILKFFFLKVQFHAKFIEEGMNWHCICRLKIGYFYVAFPNRKFYSKSYFLKVFQVEIFMISCNNIQNTPKNWWIFVLFLHFSFNESNCSSNISIYLWIIIQKHEQYWIIK